VNLGRRLLILAFFFALPVWAENQPAQITIGLNPGGNPENLKKQGLDLAKILQKELGLPVNIYVSKNYAGLIEAMRNKKIDFALFSSLSVVMAEKQVPIKILLKKVWDSPFYYSAIATQKNSKLKKPEDLKGQKIAFVDTNSASGYLYPMALLKKKKIETKDFKEVKFSGNHSHSVEMLENKEVDAIAVFSDDQEGKIGAWTKFSKNPGNFKAIWVSEPIPNDPFCVRQDFYDQYPKLTHTLMFALIEIMAEHKDSKRFSEVLGSKDLMPATSRQYDPVRDMVKSMNLGLN
jgi:phosphonate transport system substrate-binding protein